MDSLSTVVDSLVKSMPTDSASVSVWVDKLLPGINPVLLTLIAAWLGTRGIWIVKLLVSVIQTFGPLPISKVFKGIQGLWSKLAWVLNPLIMYLIGLQFTGSSPAALMFAFAGIGVREWLIKSPIPTSKEELAKLKGA